MLNNLVYQLERQYGKNILYLNQTDIGVDYTKGYNNMSFETYNMKAVIEPQAAVRVADLGGLKIVFKRGAFYDKETCVCLVRKSYFRYFTPKIDDRIVIDEETWQIKELEDLQGGWSFTLVKV
jgi:hypothetical protein